jgi:folate-dependent phosphoribosylglycinamide formyltransferase PurN
MKPIKAILLYSAGHLGSTIVYNLLHNAPEVEIVGVMRAKPIPKLRKGQSALGKYLDVIGLHFAFTLFLQWCVQKLVMMVVSFLPSESRLVPCRILAKRKGLPTFDCHNINTPEAAEFIKQHKPDVIISAYFSQLIEPEILNLPTHGVWNVHPGYLPKYRGALSYFWVLKNNEQKAGVTIHKMDAGIDTGGILDRKEFKIAKGATQQQVLIETALIGGRLIQKLVRKLVRGEVLKPIDVSGEVEHYYPMPTEADFNEYLKHRDYFRLSDMFKVVMAGIKHRRLRKAKSFSLVFSSLL